MAHNDDNAGSKLNSNDATFSDEILKLAQCLMPEPPTAKVKRSPPPSSPTAESIARLMKWAWKAYDTVIGAANNVTNRLVLQPGGRPGARRSNRRHAAMAAV